ncbi:hypothetical protein [Ruegeria sp.]|uniref:hypothetical protein n=1 Tax=Ruegeria sp. TaxID=1879320 RepID=UPI003B00B851
MNEHSGLPQEAAENSICNVDKCQIAESERIRKGEKDPLCDTVDRVLIGTDRFIIYSVVQEVTDGSDPVAEDAGETSKSGVFGGAKGRRLDHIWLRTKFPEDYECAKELRANLSSVAGELAYICDLVDSICRSGSLDTGSSNSLRRRATEMMARAMEMAYEGNQKVAKELLNHVRNHITKLRDSKNRMRYVQGNLFALFAILILWVALRFSGPFSNLLVAGSSESFNVHALDILALGAIGAFFSVSGSVSSIRVDHSVSLWEMVYTGFIRIPIGVIAAGVAIFLISGDWLLASIEPALKPWTYLLFGFIAGFSELFVPNALKQVEVASSVATPSNAG